MILLSGNMDSLVRSYSKKGFTIVNGLRKPHGIFTDTIYLQDGFTIVLSSATYSEQWEADALQQFGDHISALEFAADNADSLYRLLRSGSIPCVPLTTTTDSLPVVTSFALDSCHPIDIIVRQGAHQPRNDSIAIHKNHVYRPDWILFSAGSRMTEILKTLFKSTTETLHEGSYEYWRLGPSDDFTFVRFEALPPKTTQDPYWLSIEEGNFYFAY